MPPRYRNANKTVLEVSGGTLILANIAQNVLHENTPVHFGNVRICGDSR
jgi:hypothetical protein